MLRTELSSMIGVCSASTEYCVLLLCTWGLLFVPSHSSLAGRSRLVPLRAPVHPLPVDLIQSSIGDNKSAIADAPQSCSS